jgi:circadian clock protein KaiC
VDTWLSVHDIENNGERNRAIYVMKSRGMKNSNQVREFLITDNGIEIVDVVIGPSGVLVGSEREAFQFEKNTGEVLRKNAVDRKNRQIQSRESILNAKIAKLKSEFEIVKDELNRIYVEEELRNEVVEKSRKHLMKIRGKQEENNTQKNK